MSIEEKIEAVSVDAQWVADKLSEYGFTLAQLETFYPAAEAVALEWARRGDALISIDLVTGEMRRRYKLKFSNTMRPFLARMLRDRRSELRPLIEVNTTSRGRNRNLKVALDHLPVIGVVIQTAEGPRQLTLEEAAEMAAIKKQAAAAKRTRKAPAPPSSLSWSPPVG